MTEDRQTSIVVITLLAMLAGVPFACYAAKAENVVIWCACCAWMVIGSGVLLWVGKVKT